MLPVGQWVQYDVTQQDPRAPKPTVEEQTIGVVKQSFMAEGQPYYQVVWNPGGMYPKTALYREKQLKAVDRKTKSVSPLGEPGSNFQQPNIPIQAAPPSYQPLGRATL